MSPIDKEFSNPYDTPICTSKNDAVVYLVCAYSIFQFQGNLASVYRLEEEQFVVAKIRESHEYTTSTIYWLGGKFSAEGDWKWVDNTLIIFNGKLKKI